MSTSTSTEKLALFTSHVTPMSANGYYRLEVPFRAARNLGLAEFYMEGQVPYYDSAEARLLASVSADVNVFFSVSNRGLVKNVEAMKQLPSAPDDYDPTKRYKRPAFVLDVDDLTEYCSPFNTAFQMLGVRAPNGEKLQKGDKIFVTPTEGEPVALWEDGITKGENGNVFNVEKNWERVNALLDLGRVSDGVTTTCERLSEYWRTEVGVSEVHTYPNSILFEDYPRVDLAPHPDEVRILWQGGSSHYEDWEPLRPVLGRIAKKYPHVKWILWGNPYAWVHRTLPEHQLEILPWQQFRGYLSRLQTIGHDINLAPLKATRFSSCKTAIKWYEASMLTQPVPTLAGNVPPYSDEMVHGETGMLYDSPEHFEELLSTLIEDAPLRGRLGAAAKEWVVEYRDAHKTVLPLLEWYQKLKEHIP